MAEDVDRRHETLIGVEQRLDAVTERSRRELHLAELVDDHDVGRGRRAQRRKREPLELFQVDAVAADSRRAWERNVRERGAFSVERLYPEADATAPLAYFRGDEPGQP
jgi:hypothetical protein